MTSRRMDGPERVSAVPRDLPDQQVGAGEDLLDVETPGRGAQGDVPKESRSTDEGPIDEGLPDLDEAGAGPHGSPKSSGPHPDDR